MSESVSFESPKNVVDRAGIAGVPLHPLPHYTEAIWNQGVRSRIGGGTLASLSAGTFRW